MYDDRSRRFSRVAPHPALDVARRVGGLEYTRLVMRGEASPAPVCELVGFRFTPADRGKIDLEFEPAEHHDNVVGSVHGGITCILLDSAMSIAVHTTLPAGYGFATLPLNTHFVRPIAVRTGPCVARARSRRAVRGSRRQRAGSSISAASPTTTARQRA